MHDLYPPGPAAAPADLARPGPGYRRQAWLAVAALGLFLLAYLALAGWFTTIAVRAFASIAEGGGERLLPLLFAGGCASLLAVFMFKALFFVRRGGTGHDIEVTAAEQPRLFAFLHRLADEAGAPRPHRVFLSDRVNAAVFYDLSLLNLLLPSRKNLEIGLPLVNMLTLSELKAVLAHEFGHFAQRSMAVGSWVYIAQQVATALVARRDWLDRLLELISRIDLRVAWIGWLLRLVVWSIRSLLDSLLRVVVLAQRALSRQMEFQADLVAVSLTGSDELVHALHKLQAADDAWERTCGFVHGQVQGGHLPRDVFALQEAVRERMARVLGDEHWGRIPPASGEPPAQRRLFKQGFAQPPQMWSTHPSSRDREDNAKRRYLEAPHDPRSAWALFDGREALEDGLRARFAAGREVALIPHEEALARLDASFDRRVYDPRYRGAYVRRELTRHAEDVGALAGEAPADPPAALAALYPEALAGAIVRQRELHEELDALRALRDGDYEATGGRIVFRGREIARRALPAAIREVEADLADAQREVRGHDRACRAAHLAAAERLGEGWPAHLRGLLTVLHYAEHARADLDDASALLRNVVAVVTADGRVSGGELRRLVAACNQVQRVLARVHDESGWVRLDPALCAALGIEAWDRVFEPFRLPRADEKNINDWMRVVDGWIHSTRGPLSALAETALERLLQAEGEVAAQLAGDAPRAPAPGASVVDGPYGLLVAGRERAKQRRLGWWDRFQTADGVLAGLLRGAVALAVVATIVAAGSSLQYGRLATVYVLNALGTPVEVQVGGASHRVGAGGTLRFDLPLEQAPELVALAPDGREIERFRPEGVQSGEDYVYNIAAATILAEFTVSYGNAAEVEPRMLGAQRWMHTTARHVFEEPPASVRTRGAGEQRRVLDSAVAEPAETQLALLGGDAERVRALHVAFDPPASAEAWRVAGQPAAK